MHTLLPALPRAHPQTLFPLKDLITIIGESLGKLLSVLRDISSSSRRVEADRGSNEACKLQSAPLARTSSSDAGTPNGEAPATQVAEQHRRVPPLDRGGQGRKGREKKRTGRNVGQGEDES